MYSIPVVFCSVIVMERLFSTGSEIEPSLSHVMVGAGFPVNEHVSITLLCSMTIRELGLSTTLGSTEGGESGCKN